MRTTLVIAALSLVVSGHGARGQTGGSVASNQGASGSAVTPSFTLRPGDIVRLRIWREPELSGDYSVDEAGRINFPLIGLQSVTDETTESLHNRLVAAYRQSIQNLSMGVVFLRRVPVVGAVRAPGLYPVDPTMTAPTRSPWLAARSPIRRVRRSNYFAAGACWSNRSTNHFGSASSKRSRAISCTFPPPTVSLAATPGPPAPSCNR
jgi:Periplasmic protein involved in polysaccharide export